MRKKYLEELLSITEKQHKEILSGNVDKFIELLNERQGVIERLEDINKTANAPLSDEEREILIKVQEWDHENRKKYDVLFEEVKVNLCKARKMRETEQQYSNAYTRYMGQGTFQSKS